MVVEPPKRIHLPYGSLNANTRVQETAAGLTQPARLFLYFPSIYNFVYQVAHFLEFPKPKLLLISLLLQLDYSSFND